MTRIEVFVREGLTDAIGDGVLKDIGDLNIRGLDAVRAIHVYHIEGKLGSAEAKRAGAELLADPVSQRFVVGENEGALSKGAWVADVSYNPGVTDPVADSALKGLRDIGISGPSAVHTSRRYILRGKLSRAQVDSVCRRLLANTVIQSYEIKKV